METTPATTPATSVQPPKFNGITLRHVLYCIPFVTIHLLCFAAIWTGVDATALVLCAVLYVVRMFGVTAGYHRYFSHRTYKMNRVMQFLMACLAQSSAQKGVIWWAAHHRHHHKFSDKENDIHSPEQHGLLYAHLGWVLAPENNEVDYSKVKDLTKYPELRWLNKNYLAPAILMGVLSWWFFGWSGLVVGFFWSTVLLWHGTFTINSLSHVIGKQRYETGDDSRNNWFLALITLGEGWHNNHHYYQASTNQGFYWWEIDISYYGLKAMSWFGLVRDLKKPPQHVIENRPHPAAEARMADQSGDATDTPAVAKAIANPAASATALALPLATKISKQATQPVSM